MIDDVYDYCPFCIMQTLINHLNDLFVVGVAVCIFYQACLICFYVNTAYLVSPSIPKSTDI